ncbi:MAG: molybdopterin-dependent oxidoreductase [Chloroflexi bacterium]|nr:molybdopterin-dependent oxidoreductase [Chloroflexota bacterium]
MVRIVGNPQSTYSGGKACPRSHIGLEVLYDPQRIQTKPLKRKQDAPAKGGVGQAVSADWFYEVEWEEALSEIARRLIDLSNPQKLLLIEGLNTTSDSDLIRRFAKSYGTVNLLSEEDALETGADVEGKRMADGRDNSGYDLENAKYVLAFNAGIVESERPLARNLRSWGKIRRENAQRAKVVVMEPRYSTTAAKADEWIPIKPGAEGILAMAMASVIIEEGLYDAGFVSNWTKGFSDFKSLATSSFKPDMVADSTGVAAEEIRRLAREFAGAKPAAIAWSGTAAASWPNGTLVSHAVFCLNALVGSIDAPGGVLYQESPPYKGMPVVAGPDPGISLREAATQLLGASSGYEAAIGFNSNLIMAVPETFTWDAALAKLPFYVHVGPTWSEMAAYADLILPACTYLEEWGYETALPGSGWAEARIKQPVVAPRYQSKPIAEIVFDLASAVGGNPGAAFAGIENDPAEFVKSQTAAFVSWTSLTQDGVWRQPAEYEYASENAAKYSTLFQTPSKKFEFHPESLGHVLNAEGALVGQEVHYPLKLVLYRPVLELRNGSQNYPWAQEMFLVMHGRGWENFAEINVETASELGIGDGDEVWVESSLYGMSEDEPGTVKLKARVSEMVRPDVLAIAVGQGHWSGGQWVDGLGANPNQIVHMYSKVGVLNCDAISGQACFQNTRVRVYKA